MLENSDSKAAKDIDQQNQNTGHCIAADKLGGTVHRAKELSFLPHFRTATFGLRFINQAGVQVGIHSHLFAGHGIQREAGRYFSDTLRALCHHDKVDHYQNGENDQTHCEVTTNQEVTKGLNNRPCGTWAGVAFQQYDAGGGHVEGQAHQGGQKQHRWE